MEVEGVTRPFPFYPCSKIQGSLYFNFKTMSNQDDIKTDEQEIDIISDEQEKVDNESSETADEVDEALKVHRQKVYQGMIDKEVQGILFGEKSLKDINGKQMRSDIEKKLSEIKDRAFNPKSNSEIDEETLIAKTKASIKFDEFLSKVDEDTIEDAKADYRTFTSSGLSPDQSIAKLHKLYGVKTKDEITANGQRIPKTGKSGMASLEDKKLTSSEQKLKAVIQNAIKNIG